MSQENVELVRLGYEAWNRQDFDTAIANIDPEVEWTFATGARPPGADASYHGHAGVREFWRLFIEPWQEVEIEVEDTRTTGDLVVAFVQFHAKARDGLEVDAPFAHVFTVRDGKTVRFKSFDDRAEALEAAGLRE
jgi:ketosteroid isomerase-like protein